MGRPLTSSERKMSVDRSICRMLVECAYGEGGTGMEMVCSKPARTWSGLGLGVRVGVGVRVRAQA